MTSISTIDAIDSMENVKQKIYQLVDQLSAEQLSQILRLLQTWVATTNGISTNGSHPSTEDRKLLEQPWLQYTAPQKFTKLGCILRNR